jgi:hypothetical protein
MDKSERTYDASERDIDPREKAYRDRLGDGLEAVLGAGAEKLAEIVEGLNERNVPGPKGLRWSEELLVAELERLGV